MSLTTAQLQTLKTAMTTETGLTATGVAVKDVPKNDDGAFAVAAFYNALFSPSFTVWKTNVSIREVGDKFNGTELGGLTTANQSRLQTIALYSEAGVNPSLADRRQFFDDIFSGAGGTNTRANLLALWKRFATRIEKLFATGTGNDASPAALVFEGTITGGDVTSAWNS